jgi:glycosyltransferase involved in cell wall biosynthesis
MLSIAGSGPQEDQLRARVADLHLDERVHFLGRLFDERKEALWRSAHIFVFPTFFLEGLPYALLEAMAVGAVPVTTRAGAIPDVVEDGVHGVFVPPRKPAALAAAIARLDDDRRTLVRMAEASRQRVVERYTLTRLADDFRRLYSCVLNE